MVVLGGGAVSYARGTPAGWERARRQRVVGAGVKSVVRISEGCDVFSQQDMLVPWAGQLERNQIVYEKGFKLKPFWQ